MEPKISIRCRQVDQALVQGCIAPAVASVKDLIKIESEVTLDTEAFLPKDWYAFFLKGTNFEVLI